MKSIPYIQNVLILTSVITVSGCGADKAPTVDESSLSTQLMTTLNEQLDGGAVGLLLPQSTDFSSIPADPNNTLTEEKVFLGMMLFHETAVATEGVHEQLVNTWSCASCHHAAAGFKSGVVQGIGEGGTGFGVAGKMRVLAEGFDKSSTDPSLVPDVQPLTSPSILNTAYQEVMLWNGQFGNQHGGLVNAKLPDEILATPGTPKAENTRGLGGLETQAIAGTKVHRLNTFNNSLVQQNMEYQLLYEAAFPEGGDDILENMGKAIAAYERTVLANRAPFQRWLQGEDAALTDQEKRGALLFFGKAGCASCHTGPALSSKIGAANEEMFMAIGFADLDTSNPTITGVVTENDAKGRGGFTGRTEDNYKFKVPQLYNLKDSNVFGHGGSFTSVKQVVLYKNAGVPQKRLADGIIDDRFVPLNLSDDEIDDLVAFLEEGLYDPHLERYIPDALPSGACFPVADEQSKIDLNCAL